MMLRTIPSHISNPVYSPPKPHSYSNKLATNAATTISTITFLMSKPGFGFLEGRTNGFVCIHRLIHRCCGRDARADSEVVSHLPSDTTTKLGLTRHPTRTGRPPRRLRRSKRSAPIFSGSGWTTMTTVAAFDIVPRFRARVANTRYSGRFRMG
jgi:hypothetical protein